MRADRTSPLSANGRPEPEQPSSRDSVASTAIDDGPPAESLEPDSVELLLRQFRELGEYVWDYAVARADGFKLSLRNTVLWTFLGGLAFVAVGGVFVTAGWLMVNGLAEGLSLLCGDRVWAGNLLAGALLLVAGLAGGTLAMVVVHNRPARERKVEEYGKRQTRQETQRERNVAERAADGGSDGK